MHPANEEIFSWILGLRSKARYDFTVSGLSEPDLQTMGVETSFETFAAEKDEHLRLFIEEIASLYNVDPQNVVVTNGASEAIFLAYSVLGEGRRSAIVPLPDYGPMFNVPKALGMRVKNTLSSSRSSRGAIIGVTDPNNPTGLSLEPGIVEDLAASSRKDGGVVLINETYKEFTFPGSPRTYFGTENVVVCNTMTKFYGLGRLRVGWIMADTGTARKLSYAKWAVSGHDSEHSLWLARQVLRRRERFVERARRVYSRNIGLVRKFMERTDGVSTRVGPAPFCLVRYRDGPRSRALAKDLLEKTGVLVVPGDFFGAPRTFRLCFTADHRILSSGLDELSSFMKCLPTRYRALKRG